MRALTAAFAAFFMFTPMKHAVAQDCVPPQLLAAQAIQSVPDARIRNILTGAEAQAIIAAYNAVPPVSHFTAETVLVLSTETRPLVYIIAYTGNCTAFADTIPVEIFNTWTGRGA
jgi:hypothetical protein